MWLNLRVSLIWFRILTSSELIDNVTAVSVLGKFVVADISAVINDLVMVVTDSVVVFMLSMFDESVVAELVVVDDLVIVVVVTDSVVVASVAVVVDVVGKLRCRGTVDIPRLMMVTGRIPTHSGVKVGASIPN